MRPFYSSYAEHALRFYVKHPEEGQKFRTYADELNWKAAQAVIKALSEKDRQYIIRLYTSFDTMANIIGIVAEEEKIPQNTLWKLIGDVQKRFAKRRGLI